MVRRRAYLDVRYRDPEMSEVRWAVRGLLLATVLTLAACGDRTTSPAAGTFAPRTAGTLTVVTTDIPSPGFWEGTPTRLTGGFEYELARLLAQRFGLHSLRIETDSFHRIVEGQLDGADLALDLITPTRERSKSLDFSTPYLNAAPTVVAREDTSVPDLETARQLRWGAVDGTTFVGIIGSLIAPDRPTRIFANNAAMVSALEDGQIDAFLLDLPLAVVTATRSSGRLHAVAQLPAPELIAAALPKGSQNTDAVDSAIRAFTADGTIDELLHQWVGSAAADAEKSIPLLQTTR
jgi:polar amino acid transport system substrate-binding protein